MSGDRNLLGNIEDKPSRNLRLEKLKHGCPYPAVSYALDDDALYLITSRAHPTSSRVRGSFATHLTLVRCPVPLRGP